jgi:aspartate/methionine/tyrosine aminotransferase
MGRHVLSDRVVSVPPSATVSVSDLSKRLQASGVDVIPLGGGSPDYDTPLPIKRAAQEALDFDFRYIGYTSSRGLKELREAVAWKLEHVNGIHADPETEVLITVGAKEGLFIAWQTLLRPGDEVLIADPGWVTYAAGVQLAGGVPVSVPVLYENAFHIKPSDVREHVGPDTKAILINTPANPTGAVYTRDELGEIARIAQEHDLWVVSDEIYEYLVFGDAVHHNIGSLPGMKERTITVNGLSKTYAMTGWRVGYLAAPADLLSEMLKVHQHSVTCTCSFAQKAAVEAIRGSQEGREDIARQVAAGRDILYNGLNEIPGVRSLPPEGSIFCFPDISSFGLSSTEFARILLTEHGLATAPGSAFGEKGEGYLRVAFARRDLDMLRRAVGRFRRMAEQLARDAESNTL